MGGISCELELFEAGMTSERTTFAKSLLRKNGGMVFSGEEQKTASLLCNAAIEARVIGLDKPAMSITGRERMELLRRCRCMQPIK